MLLYCYTFEKNYMKPQIIEETVEVRETKNMYICTHGQWMPDYTTRIAKKDMEKLLRGKHYFSTVPAKNEAITAHTKHCAEQIAKLQEDIEKRKQIIKIFENQRGYE